MEEKNILFLDDLLKETADFLVWFTTVTSGYTVAMKSKSIIKQRDIFTLQIKYATIYLATKQEWSRSLIDAMSRDAIYVDMKEFNLFDPASRCHYL